MKNSEVKLDNNQNDKKNEPADLIQLWFVWVMPLFVLGTMAIGCIIALVNGMQGGWLELILILSMCSASLFWFIMIILAIFLTIHRKKKQDNERKI